MNLGSHSTLQDLLEAFVEVMNNLQNAASSAGNPIDPWQLFQKMDELRSTVDNMGGHVGMLANQGQLIEGHLETISSAVVKALEGDDDKLMERLRAKVKANYVGQREVLVQFWNWLQDEHLKLSAEDVADKFLEEQVGDE